MIVGANWTIFFRKNQIERCLTKEIPFITLSYFYIALFSLFYDPIKERNFPILFRIGEHLRIT